MFLKVFIDIIHKILPIELNLVQYPSEKPAPKVPSRMHGNDCRLPIRMAKIKMAPSLPYLLEPHLPQNSDQFLSGEHWQLQVFTWTC